MPVRGEQRAPLAREGGRRLSDVLAAELLAELTSGDVQPGDRLAPEREMAIRYGVSRTVVRETLKSLASRGVVVVRPGSGVFVARGQAIVATESLRFLVLGSADLSYEKVYEVRETIEVRVAGLAAERAAEEDLPGLRDALARLDAAVTGEDYALADGTFHLALATLAHNPLFRIILEAIGDIMMEVRRRSAYVPSARRRVTADHRRIADAILRRDAQAARRAMEEHLAHSKDIVRELDTLVDRSRAGRSRDRGPTGVATERGAERRGG